ncbi:GmrSD restriction endonuclease domain-containing protein [Helicobacter pylori]|uniref:GmrSD restriction endonucleases N-terminal domain-containing protein n=1 Tax=Helicobacter pylori TaxID=210 RepID=A0AAD1DA92_HELPX|nr:DUF262 domain-containing protein [Helicobacter pylori]BBI22347.1 hypothetical protein HPATCC43504_00412 [Helicobacter pylori]SQJ03312.1 putative type III restriction enzyme R protein [Helicobacter pylori NCTC 11637 = CCUG 17874 = ATCC 43504 = JCM 12093]
MKTTVKEIFQEEGYSIPNYQRDYAWKDKNFRDLWEDLEEAIECNKKGQGHFIGTMVVAKNVIFKSNLIYKIIGSVIIPKIYKTNLKECFIFH